MNKFILSCIILLFSFQLAARKKDNTFVFTHVNIVPVTTEKMLTDQTVIIQNGIITDIGSSKSIKIPQKSTVINAKGKYLIPGLADMHVHLPDSNLNHNLLMHLAAGVTTVRSMRGDTSHINLKNNINKGLILGPRLFISAPAFYSEDNITLEKLQNTIKKYKEEGYDLLKILSVKDSLHFEAIMQYANQYSIPVAGHCPKQISVARLIETNYSSIEHLQGLLEIYQKNHERINEVIEKMKKANVYNCPTTDWYNIGNMQMSLDELKKRNGMVYASKTELKMWNDRFNIAQEKQNQLDSATAIKKTIQRREQIKDRLELLKKLYDLNTPLLISPDATGMFAVPGFTIVEEMKLYSKAGILNKEIIRMATYNAANYFNEQELWGSIEKNKRADLVLLDEDPLSNLENITKINGVMVDGNWLSKEKLHELIHEN